jgi:hypothetical protein
MKPKAFLSLVLAAIILISIFSPAVKASTVYGPEKFERGKGKPVTVKDSFSLDSSYRNQILCVRNGDGAINKSSSSLISLNGVPVVEPKDFNKNVGFIQKNISLEPKKAFDLEVEMRSTPGSQITLWIEDESPFIKIDSPSDDTVSNGIVNVSGSVDPLITSDINLRCNGKTSVLPAENKIFSTELAISGSSNITVSGTDLAGRVQSSTLLLDGDMLPEAYELRLGFDPLNPDSDSSMTPENEAGNGISDGMEMLGGQLPAFVKSRIGADPFAEDTDSDGLSDYFELMKLGLLTDVNSKDSDGNGISDSDEDPDSDGLSNLKEQEYGTDPLKPDSDGDSLSDGLEVNSFGTNPLLMDTDNDGLSDDSEFRLNTDPLKPDSDGDGIFDGQETYTSSITNSTLGVTVAITGKGITTQNLSIDNVASPYYTGISAISSSVVDISLNETFTNATVTLAYDPSKVSNASNLSLCYFNETYGMYVPVPSTVDVLNGSVSANVSHFSIWTVCDLFQLTTMYNQISEFNREAYYGKVPGISTPGDKLIVPYNSTAILKFIGSYAWYNNEFGLWSPSVKRLGYGQSTAPGTEFVLGNYTEGTELVFFLRNPVGYVFLSGPASRNQDRLAHAYAKPVSDDTWHISWEDQYGGGDLSYGNLIYNVTFARSMIDSDGDGLPDYVETHGIMDNLGHVYYTDPNNPDSDGDGLTDGQEVGVLKTSANFYVKYSFNVISSPINTDTDSDSLDDYYEYIQGTDPRHPDTDRDGIIDSNDPEPLVPETITSDPSKLEIQRAIVLGAVFGETGIKDGKANWLVGDDIASSPYYLVGWIGFSLVPVVGAVADARDVVQAYINGDEL